MANDSATLYRIILILKFCEKYNVTLNQREAVLQGNSIMGRNNSINTMMQADYNHIVNDLCRILKITDRLSPTARTNKQTLLDTPPKDLLGVLKAFLSNESQFKKRCEKLLYAPNAELFETLTDLNILEKNVDVVFSQVVRNYGEDIWKPGILLQECHKLADSIAVLHHTKFDSGYKSVWSLKLAISATYEAIPNQQIQKLIEALKNKKHRSSIAKLIAKDEKSAQTVAKLLFSQDSTQASELEDLIYSEEATRSLYRDLLAGIKPAILANSANIPLSDNAKKRIVKKESSLLRRIRRLFSKLFPSLVEKSLLEYDKLEEFKRELSGGVPVPRPAVAERSAVASAARPTVATEPTLVSTATTLSTAPSKGGFSNPNKTTSATDVSITPNRSPHALAVHTHQSDAVNNEMKEKLAANQTQASTTTTSSTSSSTPNKLVGSSPASKAASATAAPESPHPSTTAPSAQGTPAAKTTSTTSKPSPLSTTVTKSTTITETAATVAESTVDNNDGVKKKAKAISEELQSITQMIVQNQSSLEHNRQRLLKAKELDNGESGDTDREDNEDESSELSSSHHLADEGDESDGIFELDADDNDDTTAASATTTISLPVASTTADKKTPNRSTTAPSAHATPAAATAVTTSTTSKPSPLDFRRTGTNTTTINSPATRVQATNASAPSTPIAALSGEALSDQPHPNVTTGRGSASRKERGRIRRGNQRSSFASIESNSSSSSSFSTPGSSASYASAKTSTSSSSASGAICASIYPRTPMSAKQPARLSVEEKQEVVVLQIAKAAATHPSSTVITIPSVTVELAKSISDVTSDDKPTPTTPSKKQEPITTLIASVAKLATPPRPSQSPSSMIETPLSLSRDDANLRRCLASTLRAKAESLANSVTLQTIAALPSQQLKQLTEILQRQSRSQAQPSSSANSQPTESGLGELGQANTVPLFKDSPYHDDPKDKIRRRTQRQPNSSEYTAGADTQFPSTNLNSVPDDSPFSWTPKSKSGSRASTPYSGGSIPPGTSPWLITNSREALRKSIKANIYELNSSNNSIANSLIDETIDQLSEVAASLFADNHNVEAITETKADELLTKFRDPEIAGSTTTDEVAGSLFDAAASQIARSLVGSPGELAESIINQISSRAPSLGNGVTSSPAGSETAASLFDDGVVAASTAGSATAQSLNNGVTASETNTSGLAPSLNYGVAGSPEASTGAQSLYAKRSSTMSVGSNATSLFAQKTKATTYSNTTSGAASLNATPVASAANSPAESIASSLAPSLYATAERLQINSRAASLAATVTTLRSGSPTSVASSLILTTTTPENVSVASVRVDSEVVVKMKPKERLALREELTKILLTTQSPAYRASESEVNPDVTAGSFAKSLLGDIQGKKSTGESFTVSPSTISAAKNFVLAVQGATTSAKASVSHVGLLSPITPYRPHDERGARNTSTANSLVNGGSEGDDDEDSNDFSNNDIVDTEVPISPTAVNAGARDDDSETADSLVNAGARDDGSEVANSLVNADARDDESEVANSLAGAGADEGYEEANSLQNKHTTFSR